MLTLVIFFLALAPFDFVSGTEGLHAGLRRTAWLFVPGVFSGVLGEAGWSDAASAVLTPEVALYLLLGFLAVAGGLENRLPRRRALVEAGYSVFVLAAVCGTLQVFVMSRHLALAEMAFRAGAGLLGARLAMLTYWWLNRRSTVIRGRRRAIDGGSTQ